MIVLSLYQAIEVCAVSVIVCIEMVRACPVTTRACVGKYRIPGEKITINKVSRYKKSQSIRYHDIKDHDR